jgi:hypothetical protein
MFLFALYGGMMLPSPLTRKNLSIISFLNMWSFGRWGCARMNLCYEAWFVCGLLGNHP